MLTKKSYKANRTNCCLSENENIVVNEFINKIRASLTKNILLLKLFGSKARNTSNIDSDIDILIVLKEKNSTVLNVIVDILVDVQLKYDLNISPVIYSEHEYSMNVKMDSPFTHNIAREGITL